VSQAPFTFAARPPSEVEWEDLLVRLEITPRALRLAVEDAGGDSPELRVNLSAAVGHEERLGELLESLRQGHELGQSPFIGLGVYHRTPSETAKELLERFTILRLRNFAQIQRRGLQVWDWISPFGRDRVTAYQVLQWMARADGEMLKFLRASRRNGEAR
jgi:hypothetical protein